MKLIHSIRKKVVTWVKPRPGKVFPPDTLLLELEGFKSTGFLHGVQILNDDQTPMDFVVSVLEEQLGLKQETAIKTMLEIHEKGGVLLPMPSKEHADRVATAVTLNAQRQGHVLACRAVSLQNLAAPNLTEP